MLGIFLDTETNGLNPQRHHLCEIAYKIIDLKSGTLLETFQSLVKLTHHQWESSDPTSLHVNGFTFEELKNAPSGSAVAAQITQTFTSLSIKRGSAVFICQNPSFDRAFFSQLIDADLQEKRLWPYHWLDLASMYWALTLQKGHLAPWQTGFSKDKIAAALALPPESRPHRALNGVNHLLLCYQTILPFPPP